MTMMGLTCVRPQCRHPVAARLVRCIERARGSNCADACSAFVSTLSLHCWFAHRGNVWRRLCDEQTNKAREGLRNPSGAPREERRGRGVPLRPGLERRKNSAPAVAVDWSSLRLSSMDGCPNHGRTLVRSAILGMNSGEPASRTSCQSDASSPECAFLCQPCSCCDKARVSVLAHVEEVSYRTRAAPAQR